MLQNRTIIGTLLLLGLVAAPALALELGDEAPPLKVDTWVKGGPVELKKGDAKEGDAKEGKVYVVEFWATWCGPCRMSIPHLTKLQKEYKDKGVVIVGISSSDNSLDTVKSFVKEQGDKMGYTVAYEPRGEGKTSKAYMEAFKINGIPHAFIVNREGRLAWHGHPMSMDEPLAQVVAGEFDIKAYKEKMANLEKAQPLLQRYAVLVSDESNAREADKLADEIWPLIKDDSTILNSVSWALLTNPSIAHRDLDFAMKLAQRANELTKGKDPSILDTLARACWEKGDKAQAIQYEQKAVELADSEMKEQLSKTLEEYRSGKSE